MPEGETMQTSDHNVSSSRQIPNRGRAYYQPTSIHNSWNCFRSYRLRFKSNARENLVIHITNKSILWALENMVKIPIQQVHQVKRKFGYSWVCGLMGAFTDDVNRLFKNPSPLSTFYGKYEREKLLFCQLLSPPLLGDWRPLWTLPNVGVEKYQYKLH